MGARTAIQLVFAASTMVVIIHATPRNPGHQSAGVLPARATLARPIAFVPPLRPVSPRDEAHVGQASDGVKVVARGRGDFIARVPERPAPVDVDASGDFAPRLENRDEGRRVPRTLAFPECLMPRNSCGFSREK